MKDLNGILLFLKNYFSLMDFILKDISKRKNKSFYLIKLERNVMNTKYKDKTLKKIELDKMKKNMEL